jgi:hypothetical protein
MLDKPSLSKSYNVTYLAIFAWNREGNEANR